MLRLAWNAYRGWAKRARLLQAETGRWNLAALLCVAAAAVFGAGAALVPAAPDPWNVWGTWLAGAAALLSAVGAYHGREIMGLGAEPGWIQSRAVAEGIKSECFRYAAKIGPYAGAEADAASALKQRLDELERSALDKQLTRDGDPVPAEGDKREPSAGMSKDWYKTNRIQEQFEYYRKGQQKNEANTNRLQRIAFGSGLAAVIFGALGASVTSRFAPFIGAMTTIAAAFAAYGLGERRKALVASYAAIQRSLETIVAFDDINPASLGDLVTRTEDLLESEHKAWLPQMLSTQHQPPAPPEASATQREPPGS